MGLSTNEGAANYLVFQERMADGHRRGGAFSTFVTEDNTIQFALAGSGVKVHKSRAQFPGKSQLIYVRDCFIKTINYFHVEAEVIVFG